MTLIKTCGMFRPEDIKAVNEAQPDFVGFVVDFPESHRSVTPEQLRALRANLHAGIQVVGVFVNEDPQIIAELANDRTIDIAQLHGNEDEAYIARLRAICDKPLIKAFKVSGTADIEKAQASSAEMVLLDNGRGTGRAFNWDAIGRIDRPFILAGGLSPGNLEQAIRDVHPWCVDLSSGLETDKLKDADKIRQAVKIVRSTNE